MGASKMKSREEQDFGKDMPVVCSLSSFALIKEYKHEID